MIPLTNCASAPDNTKARGAAYAAEGFYTDNPKQPQRERKTFEFYFKHCSLESRSPAPRGGEFECTPP